MPLPRQSGKVRIFGRILQGTVFAVVRVMRVRLVEVPRTLDGLYGQSFHRGGSYELPLGLAGLLMLEGWAVAEPDESDDTLPVDDDMKSCSHADCSETVPFRSFAAQPSRRGARRERF